MHTRVVRIASALVALLFGAIVAGCENQPTPPAPTPTVEAILTAVPTPIPTALATTEPTPTATSTPTATPPTTPTPTSEAASASLGSTTLHYDTYDDSGAVAEPGSYAFLSDPADPASAVTTYEALRDGTTTALLIHKSDAHATSQAALYDAVEAGDLFEWRKANDCFVRYQVTEVKPDPTGAVPRKLLAVEWMTYAFTGCSGAVNASAPVSVKLGPLPALGGFSLTVPVVHGIYQIAPQGWSGATKPEEARYPSTYAGDRDVSDITEARQLLHWREPDTPEDWVFGFGHSGGYGGPSAGYCATYLTEDRSYGPSKQRSHAFEICGIFPFGRFRVEDASWSSSDRETRVIAGRPAVVVYSPPGPNHNEYALPAVWVYDPATDVQYVIRARDGALMGDSPDLLLTIAASLFEGE